MGKSQAHARTNDAHYYQDKKIFSYTEKSDSGDKKHEVDVSDVKTTESSDEPDKNKDQVIVVVHNTKDNKIEVHVRDSDKLSKETNKTHNKKAKDDYKKNETESKDSWSEDRSSKESSSRALTGAAHHKGELKGNSTTINSNTKDNCHDNDRKASEDEMRLIEDVLNK